MKIQVTYDDYSEDCYKTLDEAREAIEESHAAGVGVDRIVEVDDDGEEPPKHQRVGMFVATNVGGDNL